MEQYGGDQYGNKMGGRTDEYGNPIGQTGMQGHGGTGFGATGTHGMQGHGGTAPGTFDAGLAGQQQGQGQLRRSGSSSSSSSEDDGMGGRRKKAGLKEKIKEKLPGGHKEEQQMGHGTQTGGMGMGGYGMGEGQQEKKGMMEKIKEKLPGGGH